MSKTLVKLDKVNELRTLRNLLSRSLAEALSSGTGEMLSSKSYIITSDLVVIDFSSIRSDDAGT